MGFDLGEESEEKSVDVDDNQEPFPMSCDDSWVEEASHGTGCEHSMGNYPR